MRAASSKSIAYVLEARFPGGTSSAVAQELRTISPAYRPEVFFLKSNMFRGDAASPQISAAVQDVMLPFTPCPKAVAADTVIIHNPAFLKMQKSLGTSILARQVIVVTHENFYRPGGAPGFDVDAALDAIASSSLAQHKILAPISPYNRSGVEQWLSSTGNTAWTILEEDWFNICDFTFQDPTPTPRDRRGRISRAGNEKFPSLAAMDQSFPPGAECNLLLGADNLLPFASTRAHWDVLPFGSMAGEAFFDSIDFMVFHTSDTCRESFGRVIAEAIAAGKLVITDALTGSTFGEGVVFADPPDVSSCIEYLIDNPKMYQDLVRRAQDRLLTYSSERFMGFFDNMMGGR